MTEVTKHRSLKCGVLYIATGNQYINEVCSSARSLKSTNSDLHCTLLTDKHVDHDCIDSVKIKENQENMTAKKFKITNMAQSPYLKTIYLD